MEPTRDPSVPEPQPSIEPAKSTAPYRPSDPHENTSTSPKLSGSSFSGRSITPITPDESPVMPEHHEPDPVPFNTVITPTNSVAEPDPSKESITEPTTAPILTAVDVSTAPSPKVPIVETQESKNTDNSLPSQPPEAAFVSQDVSPDLLPPEPKSKRKVPILVWPILAILLIGGGAAAYYFGYYNNPSVIYSQSLKNTSKGYDKLIAYADAQAAQSYKGSEGTGSFSLKASGLSSDGQMAFKSDDKASQLTLDVGLVGSRVKADARLFYTDNSSPDLYLQVTGVKGLGTISGIPTLDAPLAKLDGSWTVIDHTLIDSMGNSFSEGVKSKSTLTTPSEAQILDAAKAFGKVNQDYLFGNDKDKALLTVTKNYGFETVEGHKTYHYQVAAQKSQTKKYIEAQVTAIKSCKLNDWFKANGLESQIDPTVEQLTKMADELKDNKTFDIWMDSSQRIVYKVRFTTSEGANSYVDVGLDYKGGSSYPFFVIGHSKNGETESTFNLVATLNTSTGGANFKFDAKSGSNKDATTFAAKFEVKPTNTSYKIEKPTNAKTLGQTLSDLGYGSALTQLQTISAAKTSSLN